MGADGVGLAQDHIGAGAKGLFMHRNGYATFGEDSAGGEMDRLSRPQSQCRRVPCRHPTDHIQLSGMCHVIFVDPVSVDSRVVERGEGDA